MHKKIAFLAGSLLLFIWSGCSKNQEPPQEDPAPSSIISTPEMDQSNAIKAMEEEKTPSPVIVDPEMEIPDQDMPALPEKNDQPTTSGLRLHDRWISAPVKATTPDPATQARIERFLNMTDNRHFFSYRPTPEEFSTGIFFSRSNTNQAPLPTPPSVIPDKKEFARTDATPTITILCYHQFNSTGLYSMTDREFRENMEEIKKRGFTVVSLNDVIDFYQGKKESLPKKSLVITIDDGYRSVYKYAYPILKEFGYPWVFYIYPDFVGSGVGAVTWEHLKEMAANGMELGNHSQSHALLTKRGNKSQEDYDQWLQSEIVDAGNTLEEKSGLPVRTFSYPYGAFNEYVREKTVEAGYAGILTVIHANNFAHSDPQELNRFVLTKTYTIAKALDAAENHMTLPLDSLEPAIDAHLERIPESISARIAQESAVTNIQCFINGKMHPDFTFDQESKKLRIVNLPNDLDAKVTVRIQSEEMDSGKKQSGTWFFSVEGSPTDSIIKSYVEPL